MQDSSAETVPSSYVYMLYSQGMLKIGFTADPANRFRKIRTLSPTPVTVVLLAAGTFATERRLHGEFAADRVCGEWFRPSQDIRSFLAKFPCGGHWGSPLDRLEWAETHPDSSLGPW